MAEAGAEKAADGTNRADIPVEGALIVGLRISKIGRGSVDYLHLRVLPAGRRPSGAPAASLCELSGSP